MVLLLRFKDQTSDGINFFLNAVSMITIETYATNQD